MPAPRTCSRCGAHVPPETETCPRCGKDSSHGTQLTSMVVSFVLLMIVIPLMVIGVLWFW